MLRDIISKFNSTIKKYNMLPPDTTVIAGVSGGADSVCLLLLLCEYRVHHKVNVVAAHFNHQLRGDDADADEAFTKKLCKTLHVKCYCGSGNVAGFAEENSMSTEAAARELRYRFLNNVRKTLEEEGKKNVAIAVAHNRNDRSETVLHNIARGTGIEGLKGISFVREANGCKIIRPILNLSRAETEEVCNEYGIIFRIDKTNYDTNYTRNRIRGNVIPYLEDQLGDGFCDSLIRLSDLASTDSEFLMRLAREAFSKTVKCKKNKEGYITEAHINSDRFSGAEQALKSRIVRLAISSVCNENGISIFPDGTGLGFVATDRVCKYIENGKSGGFIQIGNGVICQSDHGVFIIKRKENRAEKKEEIVLSDLFGMENGDSMTVSDTVKIQKICIDALDEKSLFQDDKVCFDADRLFAYVNDNHSGKPVILRNRKEKDYIYPFGMKGRKNVGRLFIDLKIKISERKSVMMLACGNEIFWIDGIRRSNVAAVQNDTKSVIIINLTDNEKGD